MKHYVFFLSTFILFSAYCTSYGQPANEKLWDAKISQSLIQLELNNLDSAHHLVAEALTIFGSRSNKYHLTGLLVESSILLKMDSFNLAEDKLKIVYNKLNTPSLKLEELLNMRTTALHMLGQTYSKLDRKTDAIDYLKDCLRDWAGYHRKIEVIIELSKLLYSEERFQEVVSYLNLIDRVSLSLPQKIDRLNLLGKTYYHLGLNNKGTNFINQAYKLAKQLPDSLLWKGQISTSLGEIFLEKEQFDSSYHYFNKAQYAWKEIDLYENKISNLKGLSSLFLKNTNKDSLLNYAQIGASLASENDDRISLFYFKSLLCHSYVQLGDKSKASSILDQLYELDFDYCFSKSSIEEQIEVVESWLTYFEFINDKKQVQKVNELLSQLRFEERTKLKDQKIQADIRNIIDDNRLKHFEISSKQNAPTQGSPKFSFIHSIGDLSFFVMLLIIVMGVISYATVSEIRSRSKKENEMLFAKEKELEVITSELNEKESFLRNREEKIQSSLEDIENTVLHLSKGRSIPHEHIILLKVREGVKGIVEIHTNSKKKNSESKEDNEYQTKKPIVYKETVSLISLERVLPQSRFLRTHQSFIVNINYIIGRSEDRNSMTLGEEGSTPTHKVPISRGHKRKVHARIELLKAK